MKLRFSFLTRKESGYIALISVLVIGAIGLSVTIGILLIGMGVSRSSFVYRQSMQALGLADACAEEALQQIRSNTAFTGTSSLTLGSGTCSYTVASTGGSTNSITAFGTVGTVIRRVAISTSANTPRILISSWQETSN